MRKNILQSFVLVSVFLVIAMILSACSGTAEEYNSSNSANNQNNEQTYNNSNEQTHDNQVTNQSKYTLIYSNLGSSYAIAGCEGELDEYFTLPKFYNNKPVTAVSANAFRDCSTLKGLNIPAGYTTIGSGAFFNCSSLTWVYIPSTVTSVAENSFRYNLPSMSVYCEAGSLPATWSADWSKDQGFNIYWGVKTASGFVYQASSDGNAYSVVGYMGTERRVVIPSTYLEKPVTTIANYAFYKRGRSIIALTIPEGITSIGNHAFEGCVEIPLIAFPNSLTTIGESAFAGCTGLGRIIFDDNADLTEIKKDAFNGCTKVVSVTIPAKVTHVRETAFKNCTALATITFKSETTKVSKTSFQGAAGASTVPSTRYYDNETTADA